MSKSKPLRPCSAAFPLAAAAAAGVVGGLLLPKPFPMQAEPCTSALCPPAQAAFAPCRCSPVLALDLQITQSFHLLASARGLKCRQRPSRYSASQRGWSSRSGARGACAACGARTWHTRLPGLRNLSRHLSSLTCRPGRARELGSEASGFETRQSRTCHMQLQARPQLPPGDDYW